MRQLRMVLATVMSVCMLVGVSQSAFAAAATTTHYTVRLNNATIPWTLTNACPSIPLGVAISSDANASSRLKHATEQTKPDGTKHIVITDLVKGTAHDNNGAAYSFVYENNVTYDFDGSKAAVAMKDTFSLKGGPISYVTGFNWRWAVAATSFTVVATPTNIGVSPDSFPTGDGVTEDPSIIPGSWQNVSYRGSIFCDPI